MTEPGSLEFREHELPEVRPGGMLTRVRRTNVCGSELHIWSGGHPVKRAILGHEVVAEVIALGEGVTADFRGAPLAPGDRVVATYFQCCRKCPPCQRGDLNLCVNAYSFWTRTPDEWPYFHGTFSTHYYIHPDQYTYRVPDSVPDDLASGANCGLSQVLFTLDRAGLAWGETLVVQGAGGLGLYAVAIGKERGARVVVLDAVPARLELARAFGGDETVQIDLSGEVAERVAAVADLTGGGADVVLEVAGVPDAVSEGVQLTRLGGRYAVIGNVAPGRTTLFDPALLVRRQVTVVTAVRYQPWYLWRSLEFLDATKSRYPYDRLVVGGYGLDDVLAALEDSGKRSVQRASLTPSGAASR
jgi:threonine dehydrogenase-like Zn-dependent dehydrogenase